MTLFDVVHNTLTEYRRHTATEQTRAVIKALEDAKYIHRAMQYQDGLPMTEQDCPACGALVDLDATRVPSTPHHYQGENP
jgi:hypothetical protein